MTKKVTVLALVLALVCWCLNIQAEAESVLFLGGQMIIEGGSTEGIGGGTILGFGEELNPGEYPTVVLWSQFTNYKSEEDENVNEGEAGFWIETEPMAGGWLGFYGHVTGGVSKEAGQSVRFGSFLGGGLYAQLKQNLKFHLGGGHTNSGDVSLYSIHGGLSINANFW